MTMQNSTEKINCLAMSGSLRRGSSNTTLLEAAAELAPQDVRVEVYAGLGHLPHFNPDLDVFQFLPVSELVEKVRAADGLIVSTPEYAHGLPGSLKNALDWLVGTDAFIEKPFMLLNASARGVYAQQSLIEVLKTMSGIEIKEASATVPLSRNMDPAAILGNPDLSQIIRTALENFAQVLRPRRKHL